MIQKAIHSLSIISFSLGFLLYFLAVVVADLYGGAGITNFYYVIVIIFCARDIPKVFSCHIVPIELILYLIIIVSVEYMNGQHSIYYFEGLLQLISIAVLAAYLHTENRIKGFVDGLAISISISCVYFCLYATNSELNIGDSELRHALPFFYISSAGMMTSLGFFLGLVHLFNYKNKNKHLWFSLCLLCFLTCLYTMSKNALLSMLLISIVFLRIKKIIKLNVKAVVVFTFLMLIIAFSGDVFTHILELYSNSVDTKGNEEMINISGRGGIWLLSIESIQEKSWFGHGYFTASELLMFKTNDFISQAHNGILHALLSTGRIGFCLLSLYILRICYFVYKNFHIITNNTNMNWIFCSILYFAMRSITEASFAQCDSLDVFWFFSLSLIMMSFVKNTNYRISTLYNR